MTVLLSACSPSGVLNALAPRAGIMVTHDVPYAPGDRHTADIYAPAKALSAPVVVFIYGGGWTSGRKEEYRFVGAALARRGVVVVIPDYRLYPQVRFPAFLRDAAAAVAWARANAAQYGGDPNRFFLMGHSAGAYIAVMLTLDPNWLLADGINPDRALSGTIGLAGPYDFLPLPSAELEAIFAPAANPLLTQSITYARGNAAPLLLAAGTEDTTVRPANTEHLAAAIRRDGGQVEEKLYPGIGHLKLIGAMAGVLDWLAPVLPDTMAFIRAHEARSPGS